MDGRQNGIPAFRSLKRIKNNLERQIHERTEFLDSGYARELEDRWQQANSYLAENERDQETIDEIDFILDYFRPTALGWPAWAYIVLGAGVSAVLVLATLAVVRMV